MRTSRIAKAPLALSEDRTSLLQRPRCAVASDRPPIGAGLQYINRRPQDAARGTVRRGWPGRRRNPGRCGSEISEVDSPRHSASVLCSYSGSPVKNRHASGSARLLDATRSGPAWKCALSSLIRLQGKVVPQSSALPSLRAFAKKTARRYSHFMPPRTHRVKRASSSSSYETSNATLESE
jgi:hypothetical protein